MGDNDRIMRSARALAAAIRAKDISPMEALDACLARVDEVNDQLTAVIWRNDDDARILARTSGDLIARSDPAELPPFFGVPIPIKDLTEVAGWPVTYGSWAAPEGDSAESALVVEAFQRAGFVLSARTNTPEFGPITAAENDRYGISRNPWDTGRTPGGSSGGAAAAVAAGMFPVAHANDGGGSIRIPASCCGLVGLKVSRGRVPHRVTSWEGGAVEGVVTHDVADTAAILDVISGVDRGLWYNAPPPSRPFAEEVGADPGHLRIGLMDTAPFGLPVDPVCVDAVREAGTVLERLGHAVLPATMDVPDEFLEAFLSVVNSGLADYDGVDWSRAEPHIRAGRETAMGIDSLTYVHAVHRLQRFTREQVGRWGREFDVLLTPTMTIPPPVAGDILAAVHGNPGGGPALQVFQMAVLTSGFNMTGQPAISLPTYMSDDGLPIGVQLVGGPWEDALLLRISAQMEQAVGWADRRPPEAL
ncbi:MAG TPA: amidase [Acidimicrobiales bacterium]|jgi:amidase|nr:amidase [Acidimicrobiales bacterium]